MELTELPSNPWERLPGESDKAFAAFIAYRDTPAHERSIEKCAKKVGKSGAKVWQKWSVRWRWVARCVAWQDEQDRAARAARLAEIEEMNRRHVALARSMQEKAAKRLEFLDAGSLTPDELRQFIAVATRLERTVLGQPDQIIEQRVSRPAEELSDDELAAIATGGH